MFCYLSDDRLLIAGTHLPFGGLRRWSTCVVHMALAENHAFTARTVMAFGCTTLPSTDDERGCIAICGTIGCLSHIRACHFGVCDAGRHPLVHVAVALGCGGEPGLHRLRELWLAFGCTTLPSTDDEHGCRAIRRLAAHCAHASATSGELPGNWCELGRILGECDTAGKYWEFGGASWLSG